MTKFSFLIPFREIFSHNMNDSNKIKQTKLEERRRDFHWQQWHKKKTFPIFTLWWEIFLLFSLFFFFHSRFLNKARKSSKKTYIHFFCVVCCEKETPERNFPSFIFISFTWTQSVEYFYYSQRNYLEFNTSLFHEIVACFEA